MSLFKANYGYNLVTLFTPRQAKKSSEIAKKIVEKLIILHKKLCKTAKLIPKKNKAVLQQEKI